MWVQLAAKSGECRCSSPEKAQLLRRSVLRTFRARTSVWAATDVLQSYYDKHKFAHKSTIECFGTRIRRLLQSWFRSEIKALWASF